MSLDDGSLIYLVFGFVLLNVASGLLNEAGADAWAWLKRRLKRRRSRRKTRRC